MKLRIARSRAILFAIAVSALPLFSINAVAQIAVSSNDGKAVLVNGVESPLFPRNPLTILSPS